MYSLPRDSHKNKYVACPLVYIRPVTIITFHGKIICMRNKIRVIFEEMINTVTYVPELYVLVESLVTWWATGRCAIICLSWSSMVLYV